MKKITLINLILLLTQTAFSQEVKNDSVKKINFNQWTIEATIGDSKGIEPYSSGYYSGNPNVFLGKVQANSYSIGTRYMLSPKFGFKANFHYSNVKNSSDSGSLPFKMQVLSFSTQMVINAAKIFELENYINKFGLLIHAGIKADQMTSKTQSILNDHNYGVVEYNFGLVYGITPQYRIGNRTSLQLDLSFQNNFRQHLNWDGSTSDSSNNLHGKLITTTLGLSYSLGKQNLHGDWYIVDQKTQQENEEIAVLRKRIDEIETDMNDTDKDGVPDYLDSENNSVGGSVVDTRGKMVDLNKNGVPDELERKAKPSENPSDVNSDMIIKMINQDYFVLEFDANKVLPSKSSTNSLNNIFLLLKNNPNVSVYIIGHGDSVNANSKNEDLANSRATNIKDMLVKAGIAENRLTTTNNIEGLVKSIESNSASKNLKNIIFRVK